MTAAPLRLTILGMRCAGCSAAVEKALKAVPGVSDARVNLALATAEVDAATPDPAALVAAVDAAGFEARPEIPPAEAEALAESRDAAAGRLVLFSAVFSLPFLAEMAAMSLGRGGLLPPFWQLALATPVQLVAGWRFHVGAAKALSHGSANMDVLVSLGTSVAYLFSLTLLLSAPPGHAPHLYFEASALIVTLVLFGKWLEERAKRSASAAIRSLMALAPQSATIERRGVRTTVPVALVRTGDVAVVKPGERIPVDGVIVEGESEADESLITGESLPVAKRRGDAAIAGSVNGSGLIRVEATRVGADTTLARIAALVAAAQGGKAPIQRLVDRVAAVFVPVVTAVALVTFAVWMLTGASLEHAVTAAVSVLVIACPCALGLATPAALVAGTGAAAKAGILIRDIETLERADAVDTAVFDKTGTLTEGRPRVVAVRALSDEAAMIRLAAAAQTGSAHPLAKAVLTHAAGVDLPPVADLRTLPGGLTATVEGHAVSIGSEAFFAARGLDAAPLAETLSEWRSLGRSVALVAADGEVLGAIGMIDALRPEAKDAVARLRAQGLTPMLLSGDHAEAAARIAGELGIELGFGAATPEDKAARISALRGEGRVVAMIGDGVNDAPALAAADVGIAIGGGADAALETAGITLMRPDPRLVAATLAVARATRRTIRQNLFWAFAYNVVGIPAAAMGWLHPSLAAAAMALSSLSVVGNALRLTRWRP
jgi:Cu+-exporting ATPase